MESTAAVHTNRTHFPKIGAAFASIFREKSKGIVHGSLNNTLVCSNGFNRLTCNSFMADWDVLTRLIDHFVRARRRSERPSPDRCVDKLARNLENECRLGDGLPAKRVFFVQDTAVALLQVHHHESRNIARTGVGLRRGCPANQQLRCFCRSGCADTAPSNFTGQEFQQQGFPDSQNIYFPEASSAAPGCQPSW